LKYNVLMLFKRLGIDLDDNVADNNLTKVREAIAEARKTQKEVKFRVKRCYL